MNSKTLYAGVAAVFALATAPAWAQQADQGGASQTNAQQGANQAGALEEIVVTATRRSENLQQVPISVVAVTSNDLKLRGLQNLEDVGNAIPNINIQGGGGGTGQPQFSMRGIPSVGVYIDGVWQVSTAGFLNQEFVDVDRVEVLRGPQGTTYGRDSVGGAIRIWTKQPSDTYGADMTITTGTLDRRDVRLSVDVPITKNFRTKWTGASLYRDGYIQDLTVNQKTGGIDQQVFSGDMLWTPSDKLSFRWQYSTNRSQFTEPRVQDGIFNTAAQQGLNILIRDFYGLAGAEPFDNQHMTAGYPGGIVGKWQNRSAITLPDDIRHRQASLDVEWNLTNSTKLSFLTADTHLDSRQYVDWDNSPYQLVEDLNRSKLDVFSEEIQLSGQKGKFNWLGGLYYWNQTGRNRFVRWTLQDFADNLTDPDTGAPLYPWHVGKYSLQTALNSATCQAVEAIAVAADPANPRDCLYTYNQTASQAYDTLNAASQDGYAFFGEATWAITDSLNLTFGLRYHNQNNSSQNYLPTYCTLQSGCAQPNMLQKAGGDVFAGMLLGSPTKNSFDKITKKVALQKQFTAGVMGYVSYSEGFNSGGITEPTISGVRYTFQYEPETVKNTEVGMRADWLNRKLRTNVTLFHTAWDNIQNLGAVTDADGNQLPTLVTQNVGRARSQGVELELSALPTDRFTITLNIGLLDTKYTYIEPGTFALSTDTAFAQAPKHTYNLGLQYDAPLKGGATLTTRVDYSYSSQFWRSLPFLRTSWYAAVPKNFDESGDVGTVNARLSYRPQSTNWKLSVFGTNLTNAYQLNSGFFHGIWGFDFATVARPREAGVSFDFTF
jgi:iron complex outermembrane receptor protein